MRNHEKTIRFGELEDKRPITAFELFKGYYNVRIVKGMRASLQGYNPLVGGARAKTEAELKKILRDGWESPSTGRMINLIVAQRVDKRYAFEHIDGMFVNVPVEDTIIQVMPKDPFGVLRSELHRKYIHFDFLMRFKASLHEHWTPEYEEYLKSTIERKMAKEFGFFHFMHVKGSEKQKNWALSIRYDLLLVARFLQESDDEEVAKVIAEPLVSQKGWISDLFIRKAGKSRAKDIITGFYKDDITAIVDLDSDTQWTWRDIMMPFEKHFFGGMVDQRSREYEIFKLERFNR